MHATAVTATGEIIATERIDNQGSGQIGATAAKLEKFSQYGRPARYRKIAHQVSGAGATGKLYPDDGNNVVQAATATTITLPATMPVTGIDFVGLIALIYAGAGVGQWRLILSMNTGTRQATISGVDPYGYGAITAPWTAGGGVVPDTTSRVALLVDTNLLNEVHWKTEYADDTSIIRVRPLFFGEPLPARVPEAIYDDDAYVLANLQLQQFVTDATYRHGAPLDNLSRSSLGTKLLVEAYEAGSAAFSLWGAGA